MERLVQGGDTRKRESAVGSLDEQAPDHLKLVGDAGLHDGVVYVADHDEPAMRRRDDDLRSCLDPMRLFQREIHLMPHRARRWFDPRAEVDPKVAIPIRRDPLLGAAEPGGDDRSGNGSPHEPAETVAELRSYARVVGGR
jgi:hypothetical protein